MRSLPNDTRNKLWVGIENAHDPTGYGSGSGLLALPVAPVSRPDLDTGQHQGGWNHVGIEGKLATGCGICGSDTGK